MDTVKKLFGVMMLAVAAWMLARDPARPRHVSCSGPCRRIVAAWMLWTAVQTALGGRMAAAHWPALRPGFTEPRF